MTTASMPSSSNPRFSRISTPETSTSPRQTRGGRIGTVNQVASGTPTRRLPVVCGIVGVIGAGMLDREIRLKAACDVLAHRGPDGQGTFVGERIALGHTRLAVIDPTHASDQPMHDPLTGCVLVFNGEIYNYKELRA